MFKYLVTNVLFSTNVNHNIEVITRRYKFYRLTVRDKTQFKNSIIKSMLKLMISVVDLSRT